ncbi:hypothetical protein ACE0DR_04300 [Azotobacter sp. CWF10]
MRHAAQAAGLITQAHGSIQRPVFFEQPGLSIIRLQQRQQANHPARDILHARPHFHPTSTALHLLREAVPGCALPE